MIHFTTQEQRVIELSENGISTRTIAFEMNIEVKAVKRLIHSIDKKNAEDLTSGTYLKSIQLRDIDEVLDDVDRGERCKGCHLLFTPRSTCTPMRCDARDQNLIMEHLERIAHMAQVMRNLE